MKGFYFPHYCCISFNIVCACLCVCVRVHACVWPCVCDLVSVFGAWVNEWVMCVISKHICLHLVPPAAWSWRPPCYTAPAAKRDSSSHRFYVHHYPASVVPPSSSLHGLTRAFKVQTCTRCWCADHLVRGVGVEDPFNHFEPKRRSRTVADLVYGRTASG